MRMPLTKVVEPCVVASFEKLIQLLLIEGRVSDEVDSRSSGALNGHVRQAECFIMKMLGQEQTANLAPAAPPKLILQLQNNCRWKNQLHYESTSGPTL